MEKFPLKISLTCLLIWTLLTLGLTGKYRVAARSFGLSLGLLQLGCAIWAAVRIFAESAGVGWSVPLFAISPNESFEIKFFVSALGVVLWLIVSLILLVSSYYSLFQELDKERIQSAGEAIALPLIGAGALFTIASSNFLTLFFGWTLVCFGGFLVLAFSAVNDEDRAVASIRFLMMNVFADVLFAAGLYGLYVKLGSLEFATMNEKASGELPLWTVTSLVLGVMLRNMQLPFLQTVRHVSSGKDAAAPILFLGQLVLSSVLFAKVQPVISAFEAMPYLGLLPAITAFVAAIMALLDYDDSSYIVWIITYLNASVFLSGLSGNFLAAQSAAVTGSIAAYLAWNVLFRFSSIGEKATKWFLLIAALALTGLPTSGWGWARYLEYLGMIRSASDGSILHWILLGTKIFADLLIGVSLWAVVRDKWLNSNSKNTKPSLRVETIIPLVIISIGCFAVITGGRPFGGMIGQDEVNLFTNSTWFEKLVIAPIGPGKAGESAIDLLGRDIDILARILVVGVFALSAILSLVWFFRDQRSLEAFKRFCERMKIKLRSAGSLEIILWDWTLRYIVKYARKASSFIESTLLDQVFSRAWISVLNVTTRIFSSFEERVLDKGMIDGLGGAVGNLGKSLRLIQNGQIQFYFALGLVLMGAMIVRFVVKGG